MTSEDFSFFSQAAPSCFYRLGTGDGKTERKLHTSTFDINEDALRTSFGLMAYIALKEINSKIVFFFLADLIKLVRITIQIHGFNRYRFKICFK